MQLVLSWVVEYDGDSGLLSGGHKYHKMVNMTLHDGEVLLEESLRIVWSTFLRRRWTSGGPGGMQLCQESSSGS